MWKFEKIEKFSKICKSAGNNPGSFTTVPQAVNLQKERSQTHQKAHFRTKWLQNSVKKECPSGNIIKWVFELNFFKCKHIKVNSLFEDPHCAFEGKKTQEKEVRRQIGNLQQILGFLRVHDQTTGARDHLGGRDQTEANAQC